MHCLAGSLLWQEILGDNFFKKKHVWVKKHLTFFLQQIVLVCRSQKNQIADWTLVKKTVFPQISKALGHEKAQFTLVGLSSGFTVAANFSGADPGAKRRKKRLLQKQPVFLFLFSFLFLFLFVFLFLFRFLSLSLSLVPFLFFFLCLLSQVSLRENLRWKR